MLELAHPTAAVSAALHQLRNTCLTAAPLPDRDLDKRAGMSYIMDEARPRAPFTCLAVSAALVAWFDRVGLAVFWTCAAALLALNAVAVAAVLRSRSRTLVNRWTGSVLALNALLLGAGLGVPAAMYTAKMVVRAVQGSSAITWAKGQPESR